MFILIFKVYFVYLYVGQQKGYLGKNGMKVVEEQMFEKIGGSKEVLVFEC